MFITIEGCDGAGKSTQAKDLAKRIANLGLEVVRTREPGGTPLGEQLRGVQGWLKVGESVSVLAELFLFEAARAELVTRVIKPAIGRGAVVIADRYSDSSLAYQGYGRDIDLSDIRKLSSMATGNLMPTLTVLLDIDLDVALDRQASARGNIQNQDRFEDENRGFYQRVINGYRELAAAEPARWLTINGEAGREQISARIWTAVGPLIQEHIGTVTR